MENICFIKLINGDDIIATVDLEDEEDILIYRPLKIYHFRQPGLPQGMQLGEWLPFSEEEMVPIKRKHVIHMHGDLDWRVAKHYHQVLSYFNDDHDIDEEERESIKEEAKQLLIDQIMISANNATVH